MNKVLGRIEGRTVNFVWWRINRDYLGRKRKKFQGNRDWQKLGRKKLNHICGISAGVYKLLRRRVVNVKLEV